MPTTSHTHNRAGGGSGVRSTAAGSDGVKPNDARTIEAILHTMGVDDYDPRVTHQLLELLYRYTSCVLMEARSFAEHAEKQSIDQDDIKLAVRSRSSFTFTQPPPRDVVMQLAAERNAIPLPPVDPRAGVALPRDLLNLTRHNFRVVRPAPRPREASPDPVTVSTTDSGAAKRAAKRPRNSPRSMPIDPNVVIDVDNPSASTTAPAAATTNPPKGSGTAAAPGGGTATAPGTAAAAAPGSSAAASKGAGAAAASTATGTAPAASSAAKSNSNPAPPAAHTTTGVGGDANPTQAMDVDTNPNGSAP